MRRVAMSLMEVGPWGPGALRPGWIFEYFVMWVCLKIGYFMWVNQEKPMVMTRDGNYDEVKNPLHPSNSPFH